MEATSSGSGKGRIVAVVPIKGVRGADAVVPVATLCGLDSAVKASGFLGSTWVDSWPGTGPEASFNRFFAPLPGAFFPLMTIWAFEYALGGLGAVESRPETLLMAADPFLCDKYPASRTTAGP
ncbi:MAG: hypothetical protein JWP91_1682 [Fibrobacteres bacterium]|nr:hypothetical protein [Fibrobacterota bacterium]